MRNIGTGCRQNIHFLFPLCVSKDLYTIRPLLRKVFLHSAFERKNATENFVAISKEINANVPGYCL